MYFTNTYGILLRTCAFDHCGNLSLMKAALRIDGLTTRCTCARILECVFETDSYMDVWADNFTDTNLIENCYFEPAADCSKSIYITDGGDASDQG